MLYLIPCPFLYISFSGAIRAHRLHDPYSGHLQAPHHHNEYFFPYCGVVQWLQALPINECDSQQPSAFDRRQAIIHVQSWIFCVASVSGLPRAGRPCVRAPHTSITSPLLQRHQLPLVFYIVQYKRKTGKILMYALMRVHVLCARQ